MKTIETLSSPFKHLVMTIGELPTTFVESMSYYEALAWLVNYMEKTLLPAVNENAEATKELQAAFIELKKYVDDYFSDLNIQSEINAKLDEMASQGQLAEIISLYLNSQSVLGFDTVAAMKASEMLVDGSIVRTCGKLTYGDGEGKFYRVRELTESDTVDEENLIALHDTSLVAELLPDKELSDKLDKVRGDAERLGIGNETYTARGNSWTATVCSIRANRASTQPTLVNAPSVFTPQNGQEASLYRGRDSVALFIGNQGRNPYLSVASSTTYTQNSVTYPNGADLSKIKVGMVIDTTGTPVYSGILTAIDTTNHVFTVDGWYNNGTLGQPTNGDGYEIGGVRKIWGKNTAVTLNPSFPQVLACGEEMNLNNNLASGTNKQIIGYDCVTTGTGVGDIAYLARTGEQAFDGPVPGRMARGFVAKNCVEGFETNSDNDNDYLLLSKTLDGSYTSKRFAITNDGTMDNPKLRSVNISSNTVAPAYCRFWIFIPSGDLSYTLPDLTSSTYAHYNNRIFTLMNRTANTITLSNGHTLGAYESETYYANNVWIKIA